MDRVFGTAKVCQHLSCETEQVQNQENSPSKMANENTFAQNACGRATEFAPVLFDRTKRQG